MNAVRKISDSPHLAGRVALKSVTPQLRAISLSLAPATTSPTRATNKEN